MVLSGCGTKTSNESVLDPQKLYKIVLPGDFNPAQTTDSVTLTPLDRESGYIHAARGEEQVIKVLNNFFKDKEQALVLELNETNLSRAGLEIRMEQNKPGGTFYPHIYGPLQIPADAVAHVIIGKQDKGMWNFTVQS